MLERLGGAVQVAVADPHLGGQRLGARDERRPALAARRRACLVERLLGGAELVPEELRPAEERHRPRLLLRRVPSDSASAIDSPYASAAWSCAPTSAEARPVDGLDPRDLERVAVGELLGGAEPRRGARIVAAEHLDVSQLAMRGRGDRPLPRRLGRGDAPVERGRALLVLALRRVDRARIPSERSAAASISVSPDRRAPATALRRLSSPASIAPAFTAASPDSTSACERRAAASDIGGTDGSPRSLPASIELRPRLHAELATEQVDRRGELPFDRDRRRRWPRTRGRAARGRPRSTDRPRPAAWRAPPRCERSPTRARGALPRAGPPRSAPADAGARRAATR